MRESVVLGNSFEHSLVKFPANCARTENFFGRGDPEGAGNRELIFPVTWLIIPCSVNTFICTEKLSN